MGGELTSLFSRSMRVPTLEPPQARDTVGGAVLREATLLMILLGTQTAPFPSSQQVAPHSEVSGSCDFV